MLTFFVVLIVAVVVILVAAVTRPDNFRIERSTMIKASPQKIVPLINDFNRWSAWSPFEQLDPDMKRTVSGPASGKGSVYEWEGNSKAGKGRMEITESSASVVSTKLDFEKPFKANNIAEFTLEPQGEVTRVTWSMSGRSPYVMKLMGMFMNMEKSVGRDFDAGLASLKSLAEASNAS